MGTSRRGYRLSLTKGLCMHYHSGGRELAVNNGQCVRNILPVLPWPVEAAAEPHTRQRSALPCARSA